ncbi:MAG: hypothetical protein HXX81_07900, partial [Campylobacterales bacterium]|nr:hypothetical protein [Campylobacterales bacterium]
MKLNGLNSSLIRVNEQKLESVDYSNLIKIKSTDELVPVIKDDGNYFNKELANQIVTNRNNLSNIISSNNAFGLLEITQNALNKQKSIVENITNLIDNFSNLSQTTQKDKLSEYQKMLDNSLKD